MIFQILLLSSSQQDVERSITVVPSYIFVVCFPFLYVHTFILYYIFLYVLWYFSIGIQLALFVAARHELYYKTKRM